LLGVPFDSGGRAGASPPGPPQSKAIPGDSLAASAACQPARGTAIILPMNSAFAAELERLGPEGPTRPSTWPAPGPTADGSRSAITRTSPSPRCCCRDALSAISTPFTPIAAGPTTSPTRPAAANTPSISFAGGATNCLPATAAGPAHPVFVALQANRRALPHPAAAVPRPARRLRAGPVRQRYRTFDQLLDYCRRSANPVGRLVLYPRRGVRRDAGALSDHVCTALQLANFWQDVSRDFDVGRVLSARGGPPPLRLRRRRPGACRFTPAFAELMRFEVGRTRELFGRGRPLLEMVPAELRIDVELFPARRAGGAGQDRVLRL